MSVPYLNCAVAYLLRSLFSDPDRDERVQYVQYWQSKLSDNKEIDFPDLLVYEVADSTQGFSFAYLKEALYVESQIPKASCS